MAGGKLLVYLLRRDLRVSDNPIFHHLATSKDHGFTHLLPIFIFPAQQIEISGFLQDGETSPYPPARSKIGKFWRCGRYRAKFLAQSLWDIKQTLEGLDSGLIIRVGSHGDVLKHLVSGLRDQDPSLAAVWMTEEESYEEVQDQEAVASICADAGVEFKLWDDEKYFIDDRDNGLEKPEDLPDIFTSYRKLQEPLREKPRATLPSPSKGDLPVFPEDSSIPIQADPFVSIDSLQDLEDRLCSPLDDMLAKPPRFPEGAVSSHNLLGGESRALERLKHLIRLGSMTSYKDTRNELFGRDSSSKLSAYLAIGCLSARQIHHELLSLEDGTNPDYESSEGYGDGENAGTAAMRFELLWRDYMRLCTSKFRRKLFLLKGFRQDASYNKVWLSTKNTAATANQDPPPERVTAILNQFLEGNTGMGLIDASQRELFNTGFTSNRARQNVACFLLKHLSVDWRYGAEWYESFLIDYDVSSNWANWQYLAGVGNDPRGDSRVFNPVKQAYDYDAEGDYVKMWVPEVRQFEKVENVYQACTASQEDLERYGLTDHIMVTDPLKRIDFTMNHWPRPKRKKMHYFRGGRGRGRGRGGQRGQRGGYGGGRGGHSGGDDEPTDNTNSNENSNESTGGSNNGEGSVENGGRPTFLNSDLAGHANGEPQVRSSSQQPSRQHSRGNFNRGRYNGRVKRNAFVRGGQGLHTGAAANAPHSQAQWNNNNNWHNNTVPNHDQGRHNGFGTGGGGPPGPPPPNYHRESWRSSEPAVFRPQLHQPHQQHIPHQLRQLHPTHRSHQPYQQHQTHQPYYAPPPLNAGSMYPQYPPYY